MGILLQSLQSATTPRLLTLENSVQQSYQFSGENGLGLLTSLKFAVLQRAYSNFGPNHICTYSIVKYSINNGANSFMESFFTLSTSIML